MIEPEDLPIEELSKLFSEATRKAREETMELMGYVVEWKDGRVVKVYRDGKIEEI